MKKPKVNNIYEQAITIENINKIWNIVKKTCKNKKAVYQFALNANANISIIYNLLKNKSYMPGKFHIFLIYEPKPRLVMSQSIIDKIVNHFVANYYLLPYLESKLIDCNVATRRGYGSKYGINLLEKYINILKMKNANNDIYCLKIDISKYFYTIDHSLLMEKIQKHLIDKNVNDLLWKIINETNKDYVNKSVNYYNNKFNVDIPEYSHGKGLSIGAMSSQFLAIYYLNDLDHYIKENLHCKYYIRYMDDFIILDNDIKKLRYIWNKIKEELFKLKLNINPKSNIYNLRNGISFLGYTYRIDKGKLKINYRKQTYKKICHKLFLLKRTNLIKYYKVYSSYYGYLKKIKDVERIFKMSSKEKYESYKLKKPKSIIFIKEGSFYKTYGDDALIVWHIFGYKWNNDSIAFGSAPYMKVLDKLNHLGLSYGVIKDDELYVDNNDEVYDLYYKLAVINFKKEKGKDELLKRLEHILDTKKDAYDVIKNFFIQMEGEILDVKE